MEFRHIAPVSKLAQHPFTSASTGTSPLPGLTFWNKCKNSPKLIRPSWSRSSLSKSWAITCIKIGLYNYSDWWYNKFQFQISPHQITFPFQYIHKQVLVEIGLNIHLFQPQVFPMLFSNNLLRFHLKMRWNGELHYENYYFFLVLPLLVC